MRKLIGWILAVGAVATGGILAGLWWKHHRAQEVEDFEEDWI